MNCKKELSEIHRICPAEKIKVIPLGFDLTPFYTNTDVKRKEFRSKWKIKDNEVAIGIVGRIVPIKDHVFFIHAIENIIKKTSKKIRVFIVGDGEEKSNIQALIHTKKLSYSTNKTPALFQFTSWIKNVDEVNAGMDIICLTSKNEGTPVSLIEAQASGNPVVSTNVGGIENVISSNETGYLSEIGDIDQFSNNLLKLVENDDIRVNMSKIGRKKSSLYSFENLISNTKLLYNLAL